jgi:hypothetical protein
MSPRINLDMENIKQFCRKWRVAELALFGSVLRKDFRADSDVDVLVTFAPDSRITLFDLSHMEDELTAIVGHKVDLVLKRGIERSRNHIRRKAILGSAEVIYAA